MASLNIGIVNLIIKLNIYSNLKQNIFLQVRWVKVFFLDVVLCVVYAGPVHATEIKTETGLNWTDLDRFFGCVAPSSKMKKPIA